VAQVVDRDVASDRAHESPGDREAEADTTWCASPAVAETLAGIAAGQVDGVGQHPFGSGTIGSEVQTVAAQQYRITATAHFDGRGRTVLADVVRDVQGTRVVHWQRVPGH